MRNTYMIALSIFLNTRVCICIKTWLVDTDFALTSTFLTCSKVWYIFFKRTIHCYEWVTLMMEFWGPSTSVTVLITISPSFSRYVSETSVKFVLSFTSCIYIIHSECETGYHWINCSKRCLYPAFGKLCAQTCSCTNTNCDFANGCMAGK